MEDDEILKHNYGFATFRPHPSEQHLLKMFHHIFYPILHAKSKYVGFSCESEGTPDAHLHYIFSCSQSCNDTSKIKQRVLVKPIQDFNKMLKKTGKLTLIKDDATGALNWKYVKNKTEDKMKIIGYTYKESCNMRSSGAFPEEYIVQCVHFYYANRKLQESATPSIDTDWDLITPKNVYTKLPQVSKDKNIDLYGANLIKNLTIKHVGLANISPKQLKVAYLQLIIAEKSKDYDSNSYMIKSYLHQLHQDLDWDIPDEDPNNKIIEKQKALIKKQEQMIHELKCDLEDKHKAMEYWQYEYKNVVKKNENKEDGMEAETTTSHSD